MFAVNINYKGNKLNVTYYNLAFQNNTCNEILPISHLNTVDKGKLVKNGKVFLECLSIEAPTFYYSKVRIRRLVIHASGEQDKLAILKYLIINELD